MDHTEKLGQIASSIYIGESEEEEFYISNASGCCAESLDFGIKGFYSGIGATVFKEIQDIEVMILN